MYSSSACIPPRANAARCRSAPVPLARICSTPSSAGSLPAERVERLARQLTAATRAGRRARPPRRGRRAWRGTRTSARVWAGGGRSTGASTAAAPARGRGRPCAAVVEARLRRRARAARSCRAAAVRRTSHHTIVWSCGPPPAPIGLELAEVVVPAAQRRRSAAARVARAPSPSVRWPGPSRARTRMPSPLRAPGSAAAPRAARCTPRRRPPGRHADVHVQRALRRAPDQARAFPLDSRGSARSRRAARRRSRRPGAGRRPSAWRPRRGRGARVSASSAPPRRRSAAGSSAARSRRRKAS